MADHAIVLSVGTTRGRLNLPRGLTMLHRLHLALASGHGMARHRFPPAGRGLDADRALLRVNAIPSFIILLSAIPTLLSRRRGRAWRGLA